MRLVLCLVLALLAVPAAAATATSSAQYRAWAAFSYSDQGSETCYAVVKADTKGREAYVYVTHRPVEKSLYVFQYAPGFELKLGSAATLKIDGNTFALFTTDSGAWARGAETDRAIAEALKKGKKMSVTATAADGKSVTDTFSLSGSGLALQAIAKMCGVNA